MESQEEGRFKAPFLLEEDKPPVKRRPGLLARLRKYVMIISTSRASDWSVWLVSGLTFLSGAWTITSILLTRLPEGARFFLPFGVFHLTRLLTLAIGFILVYLSFHLYQRSRVAWWVAVLVSAAAIIPHIIHRYLIFTALLQFVNLALLLVFRDRFRVKSEFRNVQLGLFLFTGSLLIALLYGTIGFWMLDQRDFGITFSLPEALTRTLRQFVLLGNPDLVAESRQARWFLESLNVFGIVTASFAVYSLFRPVVYRLIQLPQEKLRARTILNKYGKSTNDYFKVWPDKSYFFSAGRNSFISFKVIRGVAFCLADPVSPDDKEREAILRAFLSFCTENGWYAAFLIPDEPLVYSDLGLSLLKIGEEATIDLERFTSVTSKDKYFRHVRRKLENDGYTMARYRPPISDIIFEEIKSVSDRWLTLPHHREYGFLQGTFDKAYIKECSIDALLDREERMVAFINEVPSYKPGEATFDMMRHIPGVHWGAMDYLFLRTMIILKEQDFQTFNFGVAPFVGVGKRGDATFMEKAVNQIFERLDRFVHAKGLRQYKLKYEPRWKDSYVAYQGGLLGLMRIAMNISRIL